MFNRNIIDTFERFNVHISVNRTEASGLLKISIVFLLNKYGDQDFQFKYSVNKSLTEFQISIFLHGRPYLNSFYPKIISTI
jgi:hypothetical protein